MEKNDSISILYVEDQDDVRLFLSKILSRHYTNIYLAENGRQGLEKYIEHKPDIIISDIKMPVMDGLSMSSRIKEIDPNAKIILTTAHSDMEYFIQSIEIGINQYILKPIDREKLYNAINICKEQVMLEREVKKQHLKLKKSNEMLTRQERELRESLQKAIALKEIVAKSEENFRKVAENIQDAFWLKDNKRVLFVNKAFEEMFEIPSSHLFDNPDIFKDFIHEDDKESFGKRLLEHEQNPIDIFGTEFKILTPSGKIKNIWYRDVFILGDKQADSRRLCTLSDISWKIENEKLYQDLLVAEKSAQVKQRILANVSHEMRTPLNGIMVMSQLLENSPLNKEQKDYLSTISKSGEDLEEITNNLLDISELENTGITLKEQRIYTKDFFQPILSYYADLAKNKGLYFNVYFAEGFPASFYADPKRLALILKHFCGNAIKFTNKGDINVEFNFNHPLPGQREISFRVSDTGIGIKAEFLDKIFLLFSQQEDTDTRQFEGLGLGLTICQRIATILKGNIEVKSEQGKGSSFKFSFPAKKKEQAEEKTLRSNAIPQLNLQVLCVEDKEVNQKILSIMLQNAGCTVDIAANGQIAMSMVEKQRYDVILMDIQMPVMDGITATRELRKKHQILPPIIGVSANALRADAQHYIAQGLDDYISKPVIPAVLYEKIQRWTSARDNALTGKPEAQNINHASVTADYTLLSDLDYHTLETLKEQTHHDETIINDLYNTFITESDVLLNKIKESLVHKDKPTLRDSTHALKGLSATIGALKVYHITSEMDKLHKQDIFDESESLFEVLLVDYHKIKSIINQQIISND